MTMIGQSLPPMRTRTWWWQTAFAVAMVASPFVYVVVTAGSGGGRTVGLVGLAVAALLAWRMGRAHLAVDDDGVHVARIMSTVHVPWSEVRNVHVIQSGKTSARSVALAISRSGGLVRAPMTACGDTVYRERLAPVFAAFESRGIEILHRD